MANPILSDVAAPAPHFPLDTTGLANDSSVAGLLEKVAVLKQRMSARRSLGVSWLTELRNTLAENITSVIEVLVVPNVKTGSDASSGTSSGSDKGDAFDLVSARYGNRIQVTSESEPGKLLASGLQQSFWRTVEAWTARPTVMSWPLVCCSVSMPCSRVTFLTWELAHAAFESGSEGSCGRKPEPCATLGAHTRNWEQRCHSG